MSGWLSSIPRRGSVRNKRAPAPNADPKACFESFCHHWRQAETLIRQNQGSSVPSHDDVSGVISHLEYLVTLLLLEIRQISDHDTSKEPAANPSFGTNGPCIEHLLSENLLEKLYEWGTISGRYMNVVRLEQIKIYSLLVQHFGKQLICAERFLRPLLNLLCSFKVDIPTPDVEGRLICLLRQICVVLMQNPNYVDLFFFPPPEENSKEQSQFVPVTLLLSHVHREDASGQQARAALLLCATFSARNSSVAEFIANKSNVCLVLAAGLSALYSSLPRKIDVSQADWHRLTPDDVNDISQLNIFINSLEFCNAVAQVAHPTIRNQLLDFFYQGFLLPVMGPALLQKKRGQSTTRQHCLQSGVEEQVAAIAYLELSIRSVSAPGLLKSLIRFLMDKNYDETNILDSIIPFINGDPQLAIVTISLLETLVDLSCEDLMLEIVLKYLMNGTHLMVSHRQHSLDCDIQCKAASMFLALSPECCSNRPQVPLIFQKNNNMENRKYSISSVDQSMNSLTSVSEEHVSITSTQSTCAYGLNASESLYGNYHAYLCDARRKILSCKKNCSSWSTVYDGFSNNCKETKTSGSDTIINVVKNFQLEHSNLIKDTSNGNTEILSDITNIVKEDDRDHSIGESSGYESFKYKSDDNQGSPENEESSSDDVDYAENTFWKCPDAEHFPRISHNSLSKTPVKNLPETNHLDEINIGPLLKHALEKLNRILDNNIYVNLRLTSLLTKLATYPMPLLKSFLLCPWIVLQPTIKSLYQIILSIKQEIDESIQEDPDYYRLLDDAQAFLIEREIRLANTRKNAIESTATKNNNVDLAKSSPNSNQISQTSLQSLNNDELNSNSFDRQPSSIQSTSSEPFKRNESKRRSISSITSMISKKINSRGMLGSSPNNNNIPIESPPRSTPESPQHYYSSEDNLWHSTKIRKTIINAIILDEWIKELAALAQEHVVCSISDLYQETSTNELLDMTLAQTKVL